MKKMITAIAVAGIGVSFAAGAHAQAITGTGNGGSYSVNLNEATTASTITTGDYTYTYSVTSLTNNTGGAINTVDFSGILGFAGGQGSTNFGGGAPLISTDPTGTVTSLAYDNGVLANNSSFFFDSTMPPGGTVGIVGSGNAPGGTKNTGNSNIGPGAAVPESSSFALLGLGLLPLGFFARRRMARQA